MLTRLKRDLTMADAARAPGGARVDLLLVADMVAPGARVLDVGCGDGELLRLLGEHARRRRPRHRAVARGRQRLRRQGPGGDPGRRRHRPRRLSRRRLRLRRSCRRPCRRRASRAWCSSTCCASAATPSSRSRTSATGASACSSLFGGRMPQHRQPALCLVRHAQHPFLHASRISASSAASPAPRWSRRWRSTPGARRMRLQCAVVVLEPVRRAGGVSAEPAGLGPGATSAPLRLRQPRR